MSSTTTLPKVELVSAAEWKPLCGTEAITADTSSEEAPTALLIFRKDRLSLQVGVIDIAVRMPSHMRICTQQSPEDN